MFNLSADVDNLQQYIDEGYNLNLALVCGAANFIESELAVLDKEQILQIFNLEKTSITISRKKGEKAYRIPTEGGRESGIKVKYSRFEELFN